MTKRQQNNHQEIKYPAGIKMMISELQDIFWYCLVNFRQGASGTARSKKRSGSAGMALLPKYGEKTVLFC